MNEPEAISQWTKRPLPTPARRPQPPETPDGIPDGYREVRATVYTNGKTLVVTAEPSEVWPGEYTEDHPHNCDAMGCQWEHVIAVSAFEVGDE